MSNTHPVPLRPGYNAARTGQVVMTASIASSGTLQAGAADVAGTGNLQQRATAVALAVTKRRQALNRDRQRRWRARRQGRNCAANCWVTFDHAVVDMLVRLRRLTEVKAAYSREMARAISALLCDIAHRI